MTQKGKIQRKIESIVRESDAANSILQIFKTGLSATKFGPFANLITEYIPNKRFLRLEKFAEDLAGEIKKIEDNIDIDFIKTDEFAFIFEQCFKAASENYQKEKLDAFKAIVINSLTDYRLDNYEREFFLILTNSLTVLHIKILKFLCCPHEYLSENGISESLLTGKFTDFAPAVFQGVMIQTIMMAFDDLYKYGLISSDYEHFDDKNTSDGFEKIKDGITMYGAEYYGFISPPRFFK